MPRTVRLAREAVKAQSDSDPGVPIYAHEAPIVEFSTGAATLPPPSIHLQGEPTNQWEGASGTHSHAKRNHVFVLPQARQ